MENLDVLKAQVEEVLNNRTDLADGLKGLLSTNLAGIIGKGIEAQDAADSSGLSGLTSMFGLGGSNGNNSLVTTTVTKLFDSVVAPKLDLSPAITTTIRGLLPQIIDKCMAVVAKK